LARLGSDAAAETIAESLGLLVGVCPGWAAYHLSKMSARWSVPTLASYCEVHADEMSTATREMFANVFIAMPHASAVPALRTLLGDRRAKVRRRAERALRRIQTPEAAEALAARAS
jgi:HEAT repeat protein